MYKNKNLSSSRKGSCPGNSLSSRNWLIQEEALFREETDIKEGGVFRKVAVFGEKAALKER